MPPVPGEETGAGGAARDEPPAGEAADPAVAGADPDAAGPEPLSRQEFLDKLWMALLFEEEVVATQYRDRVEGLDDVELREVLGEMITEAAEHKGELLQLIEEVGE